jgi:hypothetical protein
MLTDPLCCSDARSAANRSARHSSLLVVPYPTAISGPKSQGAIDTQPSTTQAFERVNAMINWTGHLSPRATSASERRRRPPPKTNFDFVQLSRCPQAVTTGTLEFWYYQPPTASRLRAIPFTKGSNASVSNAVSGYDSMRLAQPGRRPFTTPYIVF